MAKSGKTTNHNKTEHSSGWSGMIRDVLIQSMSKGQFPLALIGLCFVCILYLVPAHERVGYLNSIGNKFERFYVIGWFLSVFLCIVWYITSKTQRKSTQQEMNRLMGENEKLRSRIEQMNSQKLVHKIKED